MKSAFESMMAGLKEVQDYADGKLEAYRVHHPNPEVKLFRLRPIREGKSKI